MLALSAIPPDPILVTLLELRCLRHGGGEYDCFESLGGTGRMPLLYSPLFFNFVYSTNNHSGRQISYHLAAWRDWRDQLPAVNWDVI